MTPSRSTRHRPVRLLVLATALTVAAAVGLPVSTAAASKPAPSPVVITVTDVGSTVTTPDTRGAPDDFVVVGGPLSVDVAFTLDGVPTPISDSRDVTLELSVVGSSFAAGSTTSLVVSRGAVGGTFTGVVLAEAANDVVLTVRATAPANVVDGVAPADSPVFDVARTFASVDGFDGDAGVTVSQEGVGVPCTLAPDRLTCVDLVLPAIEGNGDVAFFSTGVCGGSVTCAADRDLLQVLAAFSLPKENPATLIVKCAKSLCGNGSIQSNVVKASVEPRGALTDAAPCSAKGVVDEGLDFCTDYVQSRRDGAGLTYLYLLMREDARMSCC